METRDVRSEDLTLRVREHGGPDGPHVVLVHGYPDDQSVWDQVVPLLDGLHVVTYDVRGAGDSGAPEGRSGYRTEHLVADLVAVVAATVPDDQRVHLVGHDWGSVQLWDAVHAAADPRLHGRVASFTSASGPSLDHLAALVRSPRGRVGRLARQALHSWYVAWFQVPALPERVWRHPRLGAPLMRQVARQGGEGTWSERVARNGVNGLELYRANIPRRPRPGGPPRVEVPVTLVEARRDAYVTATMLEDVGRWCADLTRVPADVPHWHPRTHPELLAGVVRDQVARHR